MNKVRDIISQLRESLRNVNVDMRFTNQFLHAKIIDVTKLILKREADTRKIFNSIETFGEIECLELESFTPQECTNIYIPKCNNIMRSKLPIPEAYQSNNGYIIVVMSIDRSVQFNQTTPANYALKKKREFFGREKYFWVVNNYLYIPDSSITRVYVLGLFTNNAEVSKINNPKACFNLMDSDCGIPDWLRKDIIDTSVQSLAGVTLRIPEDNNPNLNTAN